MWAASAKLFQWPMVGCEPAMSQELRAALEPTPIPQTSYDTLGGGGHRSAWSTWFEVAHPLAPFNRAMEVRQACFEGRSSVRTVRDNLHALHQEWVSRKCCCSKPCHELLSHTPALNCRLRALVAWA